MLHILNDVSVCLQESWHDAKTPELGTVINILDIGRQALANGGVFARWFYDLSHCIRLINYDYTDVVPSVSILYHYLVPANK